MRRVAAALTTALVVWLAVAGCGDDGSADPRPRYRADQMRARAEAARAHAEQLYAEEKAKAAQAQAEELRREVEQVTVELAAIDAQLAEAERELRAAVTAAARAKAQQVIESRRQAQRELGLRIETMKARVKPNCPPTDPLC